MDIWDELKKALDSGKRFKEATEVGGGSIFKTRTLYHHTLPNGGGSSASDWSLFIRRATFELDDLVDVDTLTPLVEGATPSSFVWRAKEYQQLKRDFARLCVALDALEAGINGPLTVYDANNPEVSFTLNLEELFESVSINLLFTKRAAFQFLKSEK